MAQASARVPSYRRQKNKPHDRAFVGLNGHRGWLGRYGRAEYGRRIAEWEANGQRRPAEQADLAVVELCDRF